MGEGGIEAKLCENALRRVSGNGKGKSGRFLGFRPPSPSPVTDRAESTHAVKAMKTSLKILGIVGTAALLLLGPGIFPESRGEPPPILVGATVSMEGKYAEPSWMVQQGYRLWEKQVNEKGGLLGRPVRLILRDDASLPDRARSEYEKLIVRDRVDLVFSPYGSPLTMAASEVAERHGKLMIACAASSEALWKRGYRYLIGMYASAERYFIGFLDLAARQGLETVGIVFERSTFCLSAAQGARKWALRFGLRVALFKGFREGSRELPSILSDLRKTPPQALVFVAYPRDGYRLLHLLDKADLKFSALCMSIAPVHPDFCRRAGPLCEGVFAPSQWEPNERLPFPGTKKFIRDFKKFAGTLPTYQAGAAYAACRIVEEAVRKTRSLDQDALLRYVMGLDTVTVIGRFRVDHTGKQVGHNPLVIQWQAGKKEIVYPVKMQTAPPVFRLVTPRKERGM